MATRVAIVNASLDGRFGPNLECLDRIYLNGWVPTLQVPGRWSTPETILLHRTASG